MSLVDINMTSLRMKYNLEKYDEEFSKEPIEGFSENKTFNFKAREPSTSTIIFIAIKVFMRFWNLVEDLISISLSVLNLNHPNKNGFPRAEKYLRTDRQVKNFSNLIGRIALL